MLKNACSSDSAGAQQCAWRLVGVGWLAGVIAGCTSGSSSAPPLTTVGGQSVSQELFSYYTHQKSGVAPDKLDPTLRASLLKDLTRLEAAALAGAKGQGADTAQAIELSRLDILAKAGATAAGVYAPPTNSELRAEYQRFTQSLPASEYHVAHILVATEGQAGVLSARLQAGEDFAKLAMKESADDSRSRGGDLGWIAPGHLPAAFTDAVENLKVGAFTHRPVHTPYGWHLIKLLEARAGKTPSFDEVKAQLVSNMQQTRYQQFLDHALADTSVK